MNCSSGQELKTNSSISCAVTLYKYFARIATH